MQIVIADTSSKKKAFVNFVYDVYADTPAFRDNLNANCKTFLNRHNTFARNCQTRPLLVYDDGHVVARAILIHHPAFATLQIGFF